MIYRETVQITKARDELTKNYMHYEPYDEDECFTGTRPINENVSFNNGASMTIKLNKVTFNKNKSNKAKAQAELYIDGKLAAGKYDQSYYAGTWTIDNNNDRYIVEITTKNINAKSKISKIILFDLSKTPDAISDLLKNYKSNTAKSINTDRSLIEIIENAAFPAPDDILKNAQLTKNDPSKLYLAEKNDTCDIYIGWCSESNTVGNIRIQTYDSRQKWLLTEYDGEQNIQLMNFEDIGNNVFVRKNG